MALVTGGSRGIGAAVALRLARDGADVALTFQRNQQRADDVVERIKTVGRRALAVRADSADPAALVARRYGTCRPVAGSSTPAATSPSGPSSGLHAVRNEQDRLTGLTKALGGELGPRAITVHGQGPRHDQAVASALSHENADATA